MCCTVPIASLAEVFCLYLLALGGCLAETMVLVAVTVACDRIWENQPVSEKINYRIMCGNSHWITKTLIKMKRKRISLEDEVSDWLQIWNAASPLDVKVKKTIKKRSLFFSLTGWFSQIRSHI